MPTAIAVEVTRPEAGAAVDVTVLFATTDETIFSGPATVSFAAGATSATYLIRVNPENLNLGETNQVTLALDEPENALLSPDEKNLTYTLNFKLDYSWISVGTAACQSAWVGNIGDPIEVPVQEAKEYGDESGQRLFRLVNPYYVMEPKAAEKGYNIQFLTTASGEAVKLTPNWQEIGEEDKNGNWFYIGTGYGTCSFFSEGNDYTIDGVMAYTEGRDGAGLYLYDFETFAFTWTCPAK